MSEPNPIVAGTATRSHLVTGVFSVLLSGAALLAALLPDDANAAGRDAPSAEPLAAGVVPPADTRLAPGHDQRFDWRNRCSDYFSKVNDLREGYPPDDDTRWGGPLGTLPYQEENRGGRPIGRPPPGIFMPPPNPVYPVPRWDSQNRRWYDAQDRIDPPSDRLRNLPPAPAPPPEFPPRF